METTTHTTESAPDAPTTMPYPKVDILALANLPEEEIRALRETDLRALQGAYVAALKQAAPVEAEVRLYARMNDIYQHQRLLDLLGKDDGKDPFFIEHQARHMGLSKEDRERIDEFQRNADLAGETFGPAGEILMHPDMKSADLFRAQLDKLVANARIAGIPEQTIQPILDEADLIVQKGDIGYRIHRWLTN
jgi:hypothetical protein